LEVVMSVPVSGMSLPPARVRRAVAVVLTLLAAAAAAPAGRAASADSETDPDGWFEAILAAREAETGRAVDSGQRASVLARMAGLEAPNAIGDSAADLVFTPLAPCRVVDTRISTAGILVAGTPREFVVAGGGGVFASQGGQAGGCGVPVGATAAMLNLVATGSTGMGHLRAKAWAAGTPVMPNASIINFGIVPGLNALANGLALPICDPAAAACTYDLHVQSSVSNAHLVADVVGYFSSVEGVLTGAEAPLEVTGSNVRLSTTGCAAGHVWKYTGSGWTCAADANTTYSAGAGLSLSGSTIGLSTLGCSAGYVWKYSGSEWACSPDADTNTTYSAGLGLDLTGTTFSIDTTDFNSAPVLSHSSTARDVTTDWLTVWTGSIFTPLSGTILAIATGDLRCASPCSEVSVQHVLADSDTAVSGFTTTDHLLDADVVPHPTLMGVFTATANATTTVYWRAYIPAYATLGSTAVHNAKIALIFVPD
jgi:hypothetical protein